MPKKKKKTRRPARADRRASAVRNRSLSSASARDVGLEHDPDSPGLPGLSRPDIGWLRFLPPSAGDILDAERPVAELFGKVPADEPMWAWAEDLEDGSTEDLVRDEYPHLGQDEVAVIVAEWDAHEDEIRFGRRRRFTALCDALGMTEPEGTFADLYQFCLRVGIAEERPVGGEPWVFPVPQARDVLDVLPADSDLAAAERAAQEHAASERLWETEWMLYGEYTEQIIDLFSDGTTGEAVTTSIGRLARLLGAPEAAARHAVAHLTSPIPMFGRSHMWCSADPLTVPAHRVITLAVDWDAHDTDKGLKQSPAQLAGVACAACGTDYRAFPERAQVVPGPAGDGLQPTPLVVCRGTCAAGYGSPAGTGQPVPPIDDRVLLLEQLTAGRP